MESINIEQSVKQGDALSCSLFILCMDPLVRKVNGDNKIEGPNIGVLDNFFPTGTYTGIGKSVSSLKHVMKSTKKKK